MAFYKMKTAMAFYIIKPMNIERENRIFFYPIKRPEEWQQLLARPDKHWRTGYSAKALAYCWQEAGDFEKSHRLNACPRYSVVPLNLLLAIR